MTPFRVTAPAGPVVALADLKMHLRVDHAVDDALIMGLERAAVAHLDGWRGILGRCILSQQWRVAFGQAGTHRLPFPDVVAVAAVNDAGPVEAELAHDPIGSLVVLAAPATVTITAAMPEDAVEAVRMAIKLLVGHWYEHRESAGPAMEAAPLAFDALIAPLRCVGI